MTGDAPQATSVQSSIVVAAPIGRAFAVFTTGIGSWWPREHHLLESELAEMVFEPRVGGHVFFRGTDGEECHFSRVLVFDPPRRVVFSWDIDPAWRLEPDRARTSEIEVKFTPEAPDRTRVELEHRNLDRHGDGWEQIRDAVGSPGGWPLSLGNFARLGIGPSTTYGDA